MELSYAHLSQGFGCEWLPECHEGCGCNMRASRTDGTVCYPCADTWLRGQRFSWHVNVNFILTVIIFRRLHGVWGAGSPLIKVDNKVQLPRIASAMCEEHHQTGNTRRLLFPTVLLLTRYVRLSFLRWAHGDLQATETSWDRLSFMPECWASKTWREV